MKFLRFLTAAFLTFSCSGPVFAASNADEYKAAFRFNHGQSFQNDQLGSKVIVDNARELKLQYSFARSGGAIAAINLVKPPNPGASTQANGVLPKNAIVMGCYIDVITTVTSGGAATLAFSTGQGAGDLLAATGKASFTAGSIIACIPTGSAATAIKLTADRSPTVTVATAALTAGVINVHIMYLLSDQ